MVWYEDNELYLLFEKLLSNLHHCFKSCEFTYPVAGTCAQPMEQIGQCLALARCLVIFCTEA
jgi:hypothetical protein